MDTFCANEEFVVIDTDAGIDDAWAILMLLSAEKRVPTRKVIGITCVHGNTNTNQVCLNVIRTLESAHRLDDMTVAGLPRKVGYTYRTFKVYTQVDKYFSGTATFLSKREHFTIPVYKGADCPLINEHFNLPNNHFFGADGFGCAEHMSTPNEALINSDCHAVVALNKMVCENKGKVAILCIGPLTNIALAIRTYPTFVQNVHKLVIMGGNYRAEGNATNCAEYNFHRDPEAAHIVLNSAISVKFLVPWETCIPLTFSLEWRDNVLGACGNRTVQLLNRAEESLRRKPSFVSWMPCDQVAAAVLMETSVMTESSDVNLTVELHGLHTRGQVVLAHKTKKEPNTTLVKAVDKRLIEDLILGVHSL